MDGRRLEKVPLLKVYLITPISYIYVKTFFYLPLLVDWPGTLGIFKDSTTVLNTCNRPEKPVILYEYEASPFCRKVREACSMLDLVVEYRPCPGARFGWSDSMSSVTEGLRTVPFMIDPNAELDSEANKGMFESDDIISYLFDTCKLKYHWDAVLVA